MSSPHDVVKPSVDAVAVDRLSQIRAQIAAIKGRRAPDLSGSLWRLCAGIGFGIVLMLPAIVLYSKTSADGVGIAEVVLGLLIVLPLTCVGAALSAGGFWAATSVSVQRLKDEAAILSLTKKERALARQISAEDDMRGALSPHVGAEQGAITGRDA